MFTTPLSQITYDQVLHFCETFAEGVRVEYKTEPANIPKVVSSFANTMGGVWVIGVAADKTTNRPILPPVGLKREPGIEERITQSALTGIHPGITPDVRVVDFPNQEDRVLVVVRVPESIEAPHAIQNATRVYIRNASTTAPVELSNIERIEYLLTRRRDAEAHRERLIERAAARSSYANLVAPRVRVVVCPRFPRGTLFSCDELHERAQRLMHSPIRHMTEFRLVHEAFATGSSRVGSAGWSVCRPSSHGRSTGGRERAGRWQAAHPRSAAYRRPLDVQLPLAQHRGEGTHDRDGYASPLTHARPPHEARGSTSVAPLELALDLADRGSLR